MTEIQNLDKFNKQCASYFSREQVLAMIRFLYKRDVSRNELESEIDSFPEIVTTNIGMVVNEFIRKTE